MFIYFSYSLSNNSLNHHDDNEESSSNYGNELFKNSNIENYGVLGSWYQVSIIYYSSSNKFSFNSNLKYVSNSIFN